MNTSKISPSFRLFALIVLSIFIVGLSIFIYVQDLQEVRLTTTTAVFLGVLVSTSVTVFWTIWAKTSKQVFLSNVGWAKTLRALILPILVTLVLFVARANVSQETLLFAVLDFAFYLLLAGMLLVEPVLKLMQPDRSSEVM